MIDPELVTRKLVLIAEDLAALQEIGRLGAAIADVPQYLDGVRKFIDARQESSS